MITDLALTRRRLLQLGMAATVLMNGRGAHAAERTPEVERALAELEPYFTAPEDFRDVSRGDPLPHALPDEKKAAVGLTRESWQLEIVSDPAHPARLRRPLTRAAGTALDFAGLLKLAERHAVRFPKVMTCLNIGCPLGMGIWEGVPLRDVIALAQPGEDIRRVVYHGYHNDDEKQLFRSSLPLGRVLEDYHDLPPVIVCYKLNGAWLDSERGGPARIVVPEAYGFKSIKWLSHVLLSNIAHANDTYAAGNNDLDSPLKSFAATLLVPRKAKAGEPLIVTGYAQAGISGISKVQVWLAKSDVDWPMEDQHFATAPWSDAELLPPPPRWGGNLPDDKIPAETIGFDERGQPRAWPLRLAKVHWLAVLPPQAAGEYTLRCRTVDEKGIAQPLPRPARKSGHAAIESVALKVV